METLSSQSLDLIDRTWRDYAEDIQIRRFSCETVILAHDEAAYAMEVDVFPQLRIQV